MEQPKFTPGPLKYSEGDMIYPTRTVRACWLWDADDNVVAAVTEDADFERSKVMLRHAAHATQVMPVLLAACEQMVKSLDGSPGDFDGMLAAHRALDAAIAKAKGQQP